MCWSRWSSHSAILVSEARKQTGYIKQQKWCSGILFVAGRRYVFGHGFLCKTYTSWSLLQVFQVRTGNLGTPCICDNGSNKLISKLLTICITRVSIETDKSCKNQRKIIIPVYISECSAQGQILHCKRRNLGCSSDEGRSSTANSRTKAAVLPGTE